VTPANSESVVSRRRLLLGAASLAAAAGVQPLIGSTASAAGRPSVPVLRVTARVDGLDAPAEAPAGLVRLDVTTAVAAGIAVPLVKLRVPLATYLADLAAMSAATDPADVAAAAAVVERDAVNLGGAVVVPGGPVSVWQVLKPGRYYLIAYDYTNSGAVPVAHALTVRGRCDGYARAATGGTIVQTPTGFAVPTPPLQAAAVHRVVNRSGKLNEAVFLPVAPGTTQAQVDAFFEALRNGGQPPQPPFIGRPSGVTPLSPHRDCAVRVPLTPGLYLLSSWVNDSTTGRPRTFDGYYRLVTVV
jgi:hypothetical protein